MRERQMRETKTNCCKRKQVQSDRDASELGVIMTKVWLILEQFGGGGFPDSRSRNVSGFGVGVEFLRG